MLQEEQYLAPGRVEPILGKTDARHGGERFGLHQGLGGSPGHSCFARRRGGPVLPVAREVSADHRQVVTGAGLEGLEQLGDVGDDNARRHVPLVPGGHGGRERRVGRSVVRPDVVAYAGDPVRPATGGKCVRVGQDQLFVQALFEVLVSEAGMEYRVAPAVHPGEYPLLARRRFPPERAVGPGVQERADPVSTIGAERQVAHSSLRERRHDSPAHARDVAEHG